LRRRRTFARRRFTSRIRFATDVFFAFAFAFAFDFDFPFISGLRDAGLPIVCVCAKPRF
jgi:hypothetical protein